MATCGADGLVVLWRDGVHADMTRAHMISAGVADVHRYADETDDDARAYAVESDVVSQRSGERKSLSSLKQASGASDVSTANSGSAPSYPLSAPTSLYTVKPNGMSTRTPSNSDAPRVDDDILFPHRLRSGSSASNSPQLLPRSANQQYTTAASVPIKSPPSAGKGSLSLSPLSTSTQSLGSPRVLDDDDDVLVPDYLYKQAAALVRDKDMNPQKLVGFLYAHVIELVFSCFRNFLIFSSSQKHEIYIS